MSAGFSMSQVNSTPVPILAAVLNRNTGTTAKVPLKKY